MTSSHALVTCENKLAPALLFFDVWNENSFCTIDLKYKEWQMSDEKIDRKLILRKIILIINETFLKL